MHLYVSASDINYQNLHAIHYCVLLASFAQNPRSEQNRLSSFMLVAPCGCGSVE